MITDARSYKTVMKHSIQIALITNGIKQMSSTSFTEQGRLCSVYIRYSCGAALCGPSIVWCNDISVAEFAAFRAWFSWTLVAPLLTQDWFSDWTRATASFYKICFPRMQHLHAPNKRNFWLSGVYRQSLCKLSWSIEVASLNSLSVKGLDFIISTIWKLIWFIVHMRKVRSVVL